MGTVVLELFLTAATETKLRLTPIQDDDESGTQKKLELLEQYFWCMHPPRTGNIVWARHHLNTSFSLNGEPVDYRELIGCSVTLTARTRVYNQSGTKAWALIARSVDAA